MSEEMTFLPKRDLLTLEELDRLCSAFVARGTRKLRITGGEPLVRRDIMKLFRGLSRHLSSGALQELTLTTNGSLLSKYAGELADCGVKRINVSIDTLDPTKFKLITRRGDLDVVLEGLDAAQQAGIAIKLNAVALKEASTRTRFRPRALRPWARHGHDLHRGHALGEVERERFDQYWPLDQVRPPVRTFHAGADDLFDRRPRPLLHLTRDRGGSASSRR